MAKKTAKKQPLKVTAKAATKTAAKNVKKVAKKANEPVKAKTAKTAPKKAEKPSKAIKLSAPTVKKVEEKKIASEVLPEKAKGKVKAPKVMEPIVGSPVIEANGLDPVEPKALKPEKTAGGKKKTALQRKKEKLEFDSNAKWADLHEKYKQVKPVNYSMRDAFEANQPIQHKVLGWGWVISSENDRLEVLFKDGKKILISNYKA